MPASVKNTPKRQAILAAAGELFCSAGAHRVSMDQIASAAGVSKQTLYSYFTNKEALFSAAIANKCVSCDLLPEALARGLTLRDSLLAFARSFLALVLSDDALAMFRTCVSQQDPALSSLFFQAGPGYVTTVLAQWLEEQKQRGHLQHPDSQAAAMQLLLMWQGQARMSRELGLPLAQTAAQTEAWLASCTDLFLASALLAPTT
ncbi:MAG: TetR/AcrR family transcriptional regulator [Aeromonas sp.]